MLAKRVSLYLRTYSLCFVNYFVSFFVIWKYKKIPLNYGKDSSSILVPFYMDGSIALENHVQKIRFKGKLLWLVGSLLGCCI